MDSLLTAYIDNRTVIEKIRKRSTVHPAERLSEAYADFVRLVTCVLPHPSTTTIEPLHRFPEGYEPGRS